MKLVQVDAIEAKPVTDAGAEKVTIRWVLTRPDGAVLAGTAELRYYAAPAWTALAAAAGLRLVQVTNTAAGAAGTPQDLRLDALAGGPQTTGRQLAESEQVLRCQMPRVGRDAVPGTGRVPEAGDRGHVSLPSDQAVSAPTGMAA